MSNSGHLWARTAPSCARAYTGGLPHYLSQNLLLQLWPVLRTLVGRPVRTVWEDAFPQLASRTRQQRDGHTGAARGSRLLADGVALGSPHPLVLTGGYAVRAHQLVNRPGQDLDVAAVTVTPVIRLSSRVTATSIDPAAAAVPAVRVRPVWSAGADR
ncbi:hypothetical protein ACWD0J_23015 [Streptomyces sp. NPDC003011]